MSVNYSDTATLQIVFFLLNTNYPHVKIPIISWVRWTPHCNQIGYNGVSVCWVGARYWGMLISGLPFPRVIRPWLDESTEYHYVAYEYDPNVSKIRFVKNSMGPRYSVGMGANHMIQKCWISTLIKNSYILKTIYW